MENRLEPSFVQLIVTKYEGQLDDATASFEGHGEAHFEGGHVYVGSFKSGTMDGDGTYKWSDGTSFSGTFHNNTIDGSGKYTWPDGTAYEGDVLNGLRHGQGEMRGPSGGNVLYKGDWRAGRRHGMGIQYYTTAQSSYYEGQWVDDQREGRGTMMYVSGNVFSGDWVQDVKCGQGKMSWNDSGEFYEGSWLNGMQNGEGEHVWVERTLSTHTQCDTQRQMYNRYSGLWKDGMRHGVGSFFYANGARYFGEWCRGKKEGSGLFVYEDGCLFAGQFVGDRMANPPPRLSGDVEHITLYLGDCISADPATAPLEQQLLDKAILRRNSDLKNIYRAYVTTADDADAGVFAMSPSAFLAFCDNSDICPRRISTAGVHMLLRAMRRQHTSVFTKAMLRRECFGASESGTKGFAPAFSYGDNILFREFVEACVRMSIAIAACHTPGLGASRAFESLMAEHVGSDLAQLIKNRKPHTPTLMPGEDEVHGSSSERFKICKRHIRVSRLYNPNR